MPKLGSVELFLLDMDGTFYIGEHLLPGARAFLEICRRRGVRHTFLTNNSSKSPADYIKKLAGMGVAVSPDEMLTSGDAALQYLAEKGFARDILLVGTDSLRAQFAAAGYDTDAGRPGAVVLGFDTAITYETLTRLCDAVRAGLPYIATHADLNCPVPGGFIPDAGAVIAFVKASTGREPDVVVGKPNRFIAEVAARRAGLPLKALCMVGDRLYTDMALGETGVQTALVLSGETSREGLAESGVCPDYVFAGLDALGEALAGG